MGFFKKILFHFDVAAATGSSFWLLVYHQKEDYMLTDEIILWGLEHLAFPLLHRPFSGMQVWFSSLLCSELFSVPSVELLKVAWYTCYFFSSWHQVDAWERREAWLRACLRCTGPQAGTSSMGKFLDCRFVCVGHSSSCAVLVSEQHFCVFASDPVSRPWISALAFLSGELLPPTSCVLVSVWHSNRILTRTCD